MKKIKRKVTVRRFEIVRQRNGDQNQWTCPFCNSALPHPPGPDAHAAAPEPSPSVLKDLTAALECDENDDE